MPARPAPGAVSVQPARPERVAHLDDDAVARAAHVDDRARARVAQRVRQRLLHDAVGGQVDAGRHGRPGRRRRGRRPAGRRRARLGDQLVEPREARLRARPRRPRRPRAAARAGGAARRAPRAPSRRSSRTRRGARSGSSAVAAPDSAWMTIVVTRWATMSCSSRAMRRALLGGGLRARARPARARAASARSSSSSRALAARAQRRGRPTRPRRTGRPARSGRSRSRRRCAPRSSGSATNVIARPEHARRSRAA